MSRQLDYEVIVVFLGVVKAALDNFPVLLPEHLRALAGTQELLVVSLQYFNNVSILIGRHLGQLRDNGEESRQARVT